MEPLCARAQSDPATPWTLGSILRRFLAALLPVLKLDSRRQGVLGRLARCGTPELGDNILECARCGRWHYTPRGCGDRHCPRCLASQSRQWLEQQKKSLLPVTYYHCVFTLPVELHPLVLGHPRLLYPLFFECTAQSLLEFGRHRLGGDLGLTMVLHTWGQQLGFHPHLHVIVTGGALSADGQRWREPKQRKFLFPVRALAVLFQKKFLAGVQQLRKQNKLQWVPPTSGSPSGWHPWLSALYQKRWNVFAKRPFGGPEQVLSYLANYTHRVALSNRRIVTVNEVGQTVTFTYRDYRKGGQVKPLTLSVQEFIRRFAMHILPKGLVRIRHYGILGNNRRGRDVARARAILQPRRRRRPVIVTAAVAKPSPACPLRCAGCGQSELHWIGFIDAWGRIHLQRRVPRILDSS